MNKSSNIDVSNAETLALSATDERYLRQAIAISKRSRQQGNHPFGSLLVSTQGRLLLEGENKGRTETDPTAHAERNVIIEACNLLGAQALLGGTLYTSAEPCAMCAGTAYWAGLSKVVYGLSEVHLKAHIGPHPENLTMDLPCRTVFAAGQRAIEVIGPALEDEALEVHLGFWHK